MKELKLEVGQKCWSIQLGDCEVIGVHDNFEYPYIVRNNKGPQSTYHKSGRHTKHEAYPSLFESNPFENQSTLEKVSEPENKAELINALCAVLNCSATKSAQGIAQAKLEKLLESL